MFLYSFANKMFYESLGSAKWNNSEEWMTIIKKYLEGKNYNVSEEDFYLKFKSMNNNLPVVRQIRCTSSMQIRCT